jgi:pyruvate/2-oxoglutarate dehydrogenase complex dihydrolipoamide dehydrogenase (E3) component
MKGFDYDVIVIGAGSAGISAVKTAAGLGKKTAIIEKKRLGGECTWSGCIPSKSFIHASGLPHDDPVYRDPLGFVRKTIEKVYSEENPGSFEKSGIEVLTGKAVFTGKRSITVNGREVRARKFILASGSKPLIPAIDGIDRVKYFTNEDIFEIETLPESLVILGGGPIGIELAQAFKRLGTRVTVVEMADRILFREDRELSDIVANRLVSEGVELVLGARAVRVEEGNGISLTLEGHKVIMAAALLAAAGRVPELDGYGLDSAGIKYSKRGVIVNPFLQTSNHDIFACGDIVGPYYFSHVAGYQGVTAGLNASLPFMRRQDLGSVLWTTYSDPELARLGLTEEEARQKYKKGLRVYRVPYSRLDRAKTEGCTEGLAKYILDRRGRLVGAHIAGKIAGELIHEAQVIRYFKIPLPVLQSVMHAYPSYSDIIRQAAKDAYIDGIINNPVVKLARKIMSKIKGGRS